MNKKHFMAGALLTVFALGFYLTTLTNDDEEQPLVENAEKEVALDSLGEPVVTDLEILINKGHAINRFNKLCAKDDFDCFEKVIMQAKDALFMSSKGMILEFYPSKSELQSMSYAVQQLVIQEKYDQAANMLRKLPLGIFSNAELVELNKRTAIKHAEPNKVGISQEVTKHLAYAGESWLTYTNLFNNVVYHLEFYRSNSRPAEELKAYLKHYGCNKTAAVYREFATAPNQKYVFGSPYPQQQLSDSDLQEVTAARMELRRHSKMPELEESCPINLLKPNS